MSMYEDQQLLSIQLLFDDGSRECKKKLGGGYDRDNMPNPFYRVSFKNNIQQYIQDLIKISGMRLNAKLKGKLATVSTADFYFQEIGSDGQYILELHRWESDSIIKTIKVRCYKNEFVQDAFSDSPDSLNLRAMRIIDTILAGDELSQDEKDMFRVTCEVSE